MPVIFTAVNSITHFVQKPTALLGNTNCWPKVILRNSSNASVHIVVNLYESFQTDDNDNWQHHLSSDVLRKCRPWTTDYKPCTGWMQPSQNNEQLEFELTDLVISRTLADKEYNVLKRKTEEMYVWDPDAEANQSVAQAIAITNTLALRFSREITQKVVRGFPYNNLFIIKFNIVFFLLQFCSTPWALIRSMNKDVEFCLHTTQRLCWSCVSWKLAVQLPFTDQ